MALPASYQFRSGSAIRVWLWSFWPPVTGAYFTILIFFNMMSTWGCLCNFFCLFADIVQTFQKGFDLYGLVWSSWFPYSIGYYVFHNKYKTEHSRAICGMIIGMESPLTIGKVWHRCFKGFKVVWILTMTSLENEWDRDLSSTSSKKQPFRYLSRSLEINSIFTFKFWHPCVLKIQE